MEGSCHPVRWKVLYSIDRHSRKILRAPSV
jgi:hypothetical protein